MRWIKRALSTDIGKHYEEHAKTFLQQKGLTFVQSNYRCRRGEIDLIMQDVAEWVFVEVKYRSNGQYGQAVEYFDMTKQKKFLYAVQHFMHQKGLNPTMVAHRIDVIAIDGDSTNWLKGV